MKYIIEHFGRVYKWHLIEYKHISKIVGKNNLIFTNVKGKKDELKKLGEVYSESIAELGLDSICILDPAAKKILNSKDCKKFKYLVFGGILGDYPPRERTKDLLTVKLPNVETRNLGKEQFPTDNAVYIVHEIAKGKDFNDLKFESNIEIPVGKKLSVHLPFRYIIVNNKPLISEKLIEFLKKRKTI